MADVVDLRECSYLCTAITTGLVLLISFFLYKCIKRSNSNKSSSKNKQKKGKDKKKPIEPNDQSPQKSSPTLKSLKAEFQQEQPIVSSQAPSTTSPKHDKSTKKISPQPKEQDIIAVDEDEWVTVKREKTNLAQAQTAEVLPKDQLKSQLHQQKPKSKQSKESVKQSSGQANTGKKAIQQQKNQNPSSDEEPFSKPVYVSPPVIEKQAEEEWQEITSTKKKKQRARKE